jgi:hypothetical protein
MNITSDNPYTNMNNNSEELFLQKQIEINNDVASTLINLCTLYS